MIKTTIQIKDFMDKIGIPETVQNVVLKNLLKISSESLRISSQKLLNSSEAAGEAKRLRELYRENSLFELTIHLYGAFLSWNQVYEPLGIPYKIYIETMKAFPRFLCETQKLSSFYKFDRGFWTWRYISGLEFRIGELEFEMIYFPHDYGFPELEGRNLISIHIPSDTDLSHILISKNYMEAMIFFKKFFPHFRDISFITDTWLLSPKLKEWLIPESNLVLFSNDYCLLSIETNSDDGVPWIFNRPSSDIHSFPEETILQKNAKKWMLSGEHIGSALGVLNLGRSKIG